MGFFKKIKEGLKKTRDAVVGQIDSMLKSFTKIDDELFEELEELLVMGDVGVPTAEKICKELRERVKKEGIKDPSEITSLLKEIIADMLRGGEELDLATSPSIILVIGVNGVGKTTTIGKLANALSKEGKKVILAAADTFRAAAIDQLKTWADRAQVDIISHNEGADPAAVVYDAVAAAKARDTDILLVDTAGRLHNKKNLMEELKKFPQIKEVRGRGLMIGLEFEEPIKELRSRLIYDEHVFTGASGTNVLRLLPPLCLSMEEADEFLARFKKVL